MKNFLKKDQVKLVNGGYLSNLSEVPCTNPEFIEAQLHAEYIVTFANLAKGKNFKEQKADSLKDLEQEVSDFLKTKEVEFVKVTKPTKGKLTSQLSEEALKFILDGESGDKAVKINKFLQQFVIIKDFEEFGLFFEEGIVKLNRIYTMEEIISAVTETIDLL